MASSTEDFAEHDMTSPVEDFTEHDIGSPVGNFAGHDVAGTTGSLENINQMSDEEVGAGSSEKRYDMASPVEEYGKHDWAGNTGSSEYRNQRSYEEVGAGRSEKRWPGWPGENVFRILVPTQKVGSVIGRKGEFIKKMCEESKARIKILDGPQGMPERAVVVSAKEEQDASISPAMDGLLRIHRQITDGLNGDANTAQNPESKVSTRLLVTATQAGTLIGKQGATIKSIQEASDSAVRVLSTEELPPFALPEDRVLEIYGAPTAVHKALELVASHLRKYLVDRSVIPLFEMHMSMPPSHMHHNMPLPPHMQHNMPHPSHMQHNMPPPPPHMQHSMLPPPHMQHNMPPPSHMQHSMPPHMQPNMPPPQPWDQSHDFPPNTGGSSFDSNLPFMPPRPHDNFYPRSDYPPFEKPPHHGISTFGRDARTMGNHPSNNQQSQQAATQVTQHMQVPLSYADAVIGAAGANISYIRRASGATITIQETRGVPGEMTVEINGTATQVQTAQQLIQNFMAEAAAPPQNTAAPVDQGYNYLPPQGPMYTSPPVNAGPTVHPGSSYGTGYGY